MENYQENKINCECGKTHKVDTKNIVVGENAISELVERVKESDYKKILIIADDDYVFIETIMKELRGVKKEIFKVVVEKNKATIKKAEEIEDFGQDLVIVIGGEEVISEGKYYCYSSYTHLKFA